MNIYLDGRGMDTYAQAAENIVSEFCKQSPCRINEEQRKTLINSIASNIFKIDASSQISDLNSRTIFLETDSLPQEMRSWIYSPNNSLIKQTSEILIDRSIEIDDDSLRVNPSKLPDYSISNQDWKDVEFVRMAKEGHRGAWFFVNPLRGSVVVKNQAEPERQLLGTLFLRGMGMDAPDCKLVNSRSDEGKQLAVAGERAGINRCNPAYYIVIDRVKGSSYSDLLMTHENIQMVEDNLIKIGELSIYDLLLGNFDRFQLDSAGFNGGNIMFENKHLSPIDTDCSFDDKEGRLDFSRLALKKIIEGRTDLDQKIAFKLEINFGSGLDPETFSRQKIKDGMNVAIEKLIQFNENGDQNRELFIKSCEERGCPLDSFPPYLDTLLSHIQSCYTNYHQTRRF